MHSLKNVFLVFFLFSQACLFAQKPFTEGAIIYKITMSPEEKDINPGSYSIIVKGDMIRKEMKLAGLDYTILINCSTNKVYSLRCRNGKNYAIELTMEEMAKEQEKFKGYTLTTAKNENKKIAGCQVSWGNVTYKDGSTAFVGYSKDWKPSRTITYERFPDANFLPLNFFYKNEAGITVTFVAQKVDPCPIENAVFRIPRDYKIISNTEYTEMSR